MQPLDAFREYLQGLTGAYLDDLDDAVAHLARSSGTPDFDTAIARVEAVNKRLDEVRAARALLSEYQYA